MAGLFFGESHGRLFGDRVIKEATAELFHPAEGRRPALKTYGSPCPRAQRACFDQRYTDIVMLNRSLEIAGLLLLTSSAHAESGARKDLPSEACHDYVRQATNRITGIASLLNDVKEPSLRAFLRVTNGLVSSPPKNMGSLQALDRIVAVAEVETAGKDDREIEELIWSAPTDPFEISYTLRTDYEKLIDDYNRGHLGGGAPFNAAVAALPVQVAVVRKRRLPAFPRHAAAAREYSDMQAVLDGLHCDASPGAHARIAHIILNGAGIIYNGDILQFVSGEPAATKDLTEDYCWWRRQVLKSPSCAHID